MDKVLLHLGEINIYTSGLIAAGSLIFGFIVCWLLLLKYKNRTSNKFDTLLYITLSGLLGAKVLYVFFNFYKYDYDSIWQFFISDMGFIAYGGIISATLFCIWHAIKYTERVWFWLDNLIIGFFGGLLVWQLGNNFLISHVNFDYKIFWLVVTIIYLLILRFRYYTKEIEGLLYFSGIISFSTMQIAFDIFLPEKRYLWSVTTNQVFSLLVFVFLTIFWFNYSNKKTIWVILAEKYLLTKKMIKQKRR